MGKILAELGDEDVQAARRVEVGCFPYGGQDVVALDYLSFSAAEHFEYFCFFGCQCLALRAVAEQVLRGQETITADGISFFCGNVHGLWGRGTLFYLQHSPDMGIQLFGQERLLDVEVGAR